MLNGKNFEVSMRNNIALSGLLLVNLASNVMASNIDPKIAREFANTYAKIALLNYQESANTAALLEEKIEALVDEPSAINLEEAKKAWLASRIPYGQSEVFRFVEGPIDGIGVDGKEGPEGRLNAWPLNEAYIDYVKDNPKSGIIQDLSVKIDDDLLISKNQQDDEADVTTGYHAIEFLLWGQDLNAKGAGERTFEDYVQSNDVNKRRGQYLEEAAELLVKDLLLVTRAWDEKEGDYRKKFLAKSAEDVLSEALTSMATLSGFELASERIATALDSGDQEDEHSCFSDNTHVDFVMNAKAIDNLYYGRYGQYQGTGVDVLAKKVDPALAKRIDAQLATTKRLVESIKPPVDQILASAKESPDRQVLEDLVKSLQDQAALFIELGKKLGLTIAIKNS